MPGPLSDQALREQCVYVASPLPIGQLSQHNYQEQLQHGHPLISEAMQETNEMIIKLKKL